MQEMYEISDKKKVAEAVRLVKFPAKLHKKATKYRRWHKSTEGFFFPLFILHWLSPYKQMFVGIHLFCYIFTPVFCCF